MNTRNRIPTDLANDSRHQLQLELDRINGMEEECEVENAREQLLVDTCEHYAVDENCIVARLQYQLSVYAEIDRVIADLEVAA